MWIVPSRERPEKVARFLKCYERTQATTPLWIVIDETDPKIADYEALGCPLLIRPGETVGCAAKVAYAHAMRPHEPFYGIFADDIEPLTKGWDIALKLAAMPDRVAYPNDLLHTPRYFPLPCIGADLVRRVGFLALPAIEHYGIDNFWCHLARRTGRLRYLKDHVVRLTDNMPGVAWDNVKARQKSRQGEDSSAWQAYRTGPEFSTLVGRLKC